MKEKILEALKKLDPTNDNQWTQDGLPKLEALKFMMGGENATREQVNEAAPGFTRDNPIIGDGSNGDNTGSDPTATGEQAAPVQQEQPTAQEPTPDAPSVSAVETSTEGEAAQAGGAKSVVTMSVGVNVTLDDALKSVLGDLELVDVKSLDDDELAELAAKHSDILSADNQFLSAVNEFVTKRALYLNEVVEEQSKRVPPQSQADILAAFHNSVHANAANLPINKARQVQNRGPQFFGK